jgi:hypothetical protein
MITRKAVIETVVVVSVMILVLPILVNWLSEIKHERVAAQIVESYRRSAARGEVVQPGTNSHAPACESILYCYYSLPGYVTVKTANGNTIVYDVKHQSNSTAWTFHFSWGTDANSHWITNLPLSTANR